jgi:hypothetical protein
MRLKINSPYFIPLFMSKAFFLFLLIAVRFNGQAQNIHWEWAESANGTLEDNGNDIATDLFGNTYITGNFTSPSINFGSITLTNPFSPDPQIFVAKYNTGGIVQWAEAFGGEDYDAGRSIAVDAFSNVYITGSFRSDSLAFGNSTLVNSGGGDMFIAKLNAAGHVLWAKSAAGSNNYDEGMSVATDATGNVFVTGYSRSSSITFGTIVLNQLGMNTYMDGFVVKYSSMGTVVWAKNFGASADELPYGLAVAKDRNMYITGYFDSPVWNWGSGTVNCYSANPDFFILKCDSAGNVVWLKRGGGLNYEKGFDITLDNHDNPVAIGYFDSQNAFFANDTLRGLAGFVFMAKYNPQGNLVWAKDSMGGRPGSGWSITADTAGNIYSTGYYGGVTGMDFGNTHLSTSGGRDVFIAKLDSSGNSVWAVNPLGTNDEEGKAIAVDHSGNIYVTGYFKSATDTFGTSIISNSGNADVFIAKIETAVLSALSALYSVIHPVCYGLPTGSATVIVAGGVPPYSFTWSNGASGSTANNLSSGNYFVTIQDNSGNMLIDTITITAPPSIDAGIFLSAPSVCPGDSIMAVGMVSGGTPPFNFSWTTNNNDFTFGDTIYLYHPDSLFMIVVDDNGCTYLTDTIIDSCILASVPGDYYTDKMKLYPNPSTGKLLLEYVLPSTCKKASVRVYDLSCRLAEEIEINPSFSSRYLETHFDNGMYLYSLIADDKLLTTIKIVFIE